MFDLIHIKTMVDFSNKNSQSHFSNTQEVVNVKLQTPSDLARLVKNARTRRSLTQQDVADAVGITRQSLARLERGNGGTSFDTVLLILENLGIHLDATAERRTADPATLATLATRGAAQAAADALAKRITPPIDISGLPTQIEGTLDPDTLTSIREASRAITARLTIPGSVLLASPRAVEASSSATAKADEDADLDTARGVE